MNRGTIKNSLLLLTTACIWGFAFVSQSVGLEHVGPLTFNGVRSLLGGIVLLPVIWFLNRGKQEEQPRSATWIGGLCCGLALCAASTAQQMGIQYTEVGKAGFITALYIIFVPILGLFMRQKPTKRVWIGAILALIGFYLLCGGGVFTLGKGEILLLAGAILFAVHILVIDHFSPRADGVTMSCIQFFVTGIICIILSLITEHPTVSGLQGASVAILYAGIMSCGVAYTLQIVGQRNMDPTVASLILSLESVISVLAGWLMLGQKLSVWELLGCAIVFAAVVLVQLPEKKASE